MSVSLEKGQSVSLEKTASDIGITDLKNVSIALGWDITKKSSFDEDLDVWALELGDFVPKKENLVYYGNKKSSDKMISHLGDNLTGQGEGDDETMLCWLSSLPATVKYVVIGVTIYKGVMRHQAFSDVDNAFIRLYTYKNEREVELLRYTDKFNEISRDFTSMIFGVLERTPTGWKFNASGEPSKIREIPEALNVYKQYTLNKVADKPNKNGGTKHMAVSLSKGGKVSLAKAASDAGVSVLKKVGVGLGWDVNRYDGGADFDLDASAFLTKGDGKVANDNNFIFYNNKDAAGVHHTGDNRTGDGEGDDELIEITLDQVAQDVEQINFTVTIHEADARHQNFGMVERAYIRVFDLETGTELIRYDLGEDFSIETAIVVGQLYRHGGEWKFNAIGSGFSGGLAALCKNFGVNI